MKFYLILEFCQFFSSLSNLGTIIEKFKVSIHFNVKIATEARVIQSLKKRKSEANFRKGGGGTTCPPPNPKAATEILISRNSAAQHRALQIILDIVFRSNSLNAKKYWC